MPKVLRIINRFNLGGPTYNAAYLTKYLDPEFETLLIGGSPIEGEAHSGFILDKLNVRYQEIEEMSRSIHPLHDIRAFLKIRKIIRDFKPDIVHTHAAKAGALGRIAAWLEGVPVIVHTYHGHVFSTYFGSFKSGIVKFIERKLARISHAIITISKKQFEEIINQYEITTPDKAHIVPLGFDLSRFQENVHAKRIAFREKYFLDDSTTAIGIIGRFAPVKNHALFFESLRKLNKSDTNWRAFIIGDGSAKQEMMNSLVDLGCTENETEKARIVFTSWIKNIDEALAGLDVVVLTSKNEGTPVSLIEAQASGKPVVTTDAGGVSDCILENESGYIVTDTPEAIAEKLEELILNPAQCVQMGKKGIDFVQKRFHYTRLVKDVQSLYRKLLNEKLN
jgi:glycosyltransferase involved in cell wall biosynthesis